MKRAAMVVLWPAFVVAAAGTVLLFLGLDPVDERWVGPFELGRTAGYTLGFLFLWALAAASSAFTRFLSHTADKVNQRPEL